MRTMLAIGCVILLGMSTVVAQQEMGFEELDLNGDGLVNKEEAASVETLIEVFDGADADQDGMLSKDEYDAAITKAE